MEPPASPPAAASGEAQRASLADPFRLDGRVALVTGGGSGLGFAMARGLARAGARVVLNGRDTGRLDRAAAALRGEGLADEQQAFDVTDEAAVAEAIPAVHARLGGIDVLVNNAAVNPRQPFETFTLAQWRRVQASNVEGPFLVTRAVVPGMKARGRGKIINVCSLASDLGRAGIAAYGASKGALRTLTRALAVELAPSGIQVNGIVPGFFDTDMTAHLVRDAEFSAWLARRVPAGRWARPEEIAGAAVFLASEASDFVTGHVLHVDGGYAASY
jgi:gluconate 5-dehydrogenase